MKKCFFSLCKKVVLGGMVALIIFIGYVHYVILPYEHKIVIPEALSASSTAIGLIFGGGMKAPGVMSDMQTDRVITGVELYKKGMVGKLMMTGDDGAFRGDEVTFMKQFAIDQGVPSEAIAIDPHGYRTYESCFRGKNVYGFTRVIAVSQTFHLPRILYLCNGMGIETHGVAADLHGYGLGIVRADIREVLARVKAWWQLEVTKPLPRSLASE